MFGCSIRHSNACIGTGKHLMCCRIRLKRVVRRPLLVKGKEAVRTLRGGFTPPLTRERQMGSGQMGSAEIAKIAMFSPPRMQQCKKLGSTRIIHATKKNSGARGAISGLLSSSLSQRKTNGVGTNGVCRNRPKCNFPPPKMSNNKKRQKCQQL